MSNEQMQSWCELALELEEKNAELQKEVVAVNAHYDALYAAYEKLKVARSSTIYLLIGGEDWESRVVLGAYSSIEAALEHPFVAQREWKSPGIAYDGTPFAKDENGRGYCFHVLRVDSHCPAHEGIPVGLPI